MRVKFDEVEPTKLCHARPGDVVRFIGSNAEDGDHAYLVCVADPKYLPTRWTGTGLYDVESCSLLFVNLASGVPLKSPPHLSSRMLIYRKAEVALNRAEK